MDSEENTGEAPSGSETLKCITCNRSYSSFSALSKHMHTKVHLHNVKVSKGQSGVPYVEETTTTRDTLRPRTTFPTYNPTMFGDDIYASPARMKKLRCRVCYLVFRFPAELRRHLRTKKHRTNEHIAESGPIFGNSKQTFICPMDNCNFICAKGIKLLNHMKVHGLSKDESQFLNPQETGGNRPVMYNRRDQPDVYGRVARMNREFKEEERRQFEQTSNSNFIEESSQPGLSRLRTALERKVPRNYMPGESYFDSSSSSPSSGSYKFKCNLCNKGFKQQYALSEHAIYCNGPNSEHMDTEEIEGEVEEEEEDDDEIEDEEIETEDDMDESVSSKEMYCSWCGISFTSRSVFINHIQMYHKGSSLEDGLSRPKPLSGLRAANRAGFDFTCNHCGKSFNSASALNYHLKLHQQQLQQQKKVPQQQQQMQQQRQLQQQQFQQQQEQMLGEQNFSQGQMSEQRYKQEQQQEQMLTEQKLKQDQQQPTFSVDDVDDEDDDDVDDDDDDHETYPQQELPQEERVVQQQDHDLQNRRPTHDEISEMTSIYTCKICKKVYDRRRSFQEHIRSHFLPPGSRKILCHKCFKPFSSRSEFGVHRRSGICYPIKLKLYPCNICQHSFKNPQSLEEHKLQVHPQSDMSESHLEGSHFMSNFNNEQFVSYDYPEAEEPAPPPPPPKSEAVMPPVQNIYSSQGSYFPCSLCRKGFPKMSSLKKHIWNAHTKKRTFFTEYYSKPSLSISSHSKIRRIKHWKCRHCKSAHISRRMLIHHLKRCQYNLIQEAEGTCLQCGRWCESNKQKLCRFCIPETSIVPMDQIPQPSVSYAPSVKEPTVSTDFEEPMDSSFFDFDSSSNSQNYNKKLRTMKDINFIKCPAGNKYFLKEIHMIKHYSQCDGNCENRCSHCRKIFSSPYEYKHHLIYNKCYGPRGVPKSMQNAFSESSRPYDLTVQRADASNRQFDPMIPGSSENMSLDESVVESDVSLPSSSAFISQDPGSRICNICNKPILMQRALYRHIYNCFKTHMFSQESITCYSCERTFSKYLTMRENTALLKSHVLDCYYVPYYEGEDVLENGEPAPPKPPFLCYVCSFGFSVNERLHKHIKEHRNNKDETNKIVLRLEELVALPQASQPEVSIVEDVEPDQQESMTIEPPLPIQTVTEEDDNETMTISKKKLINMKKYSSRNYLHRHFPAKKLIRRATIYECDICQRKFINRNKYRNHKKVHGIVKKSLMAENDSINSESVSNPYEYSGAGASNDGGDLQEVEEIVEEVEEEVEDEAEEELELGDSVSVSETPSSGQFQAGFQNEPVPATNESTNPNNTVSETISSDQANCMNDYSQS